MYRVAEEQGGAFKIDPRNMLFILQERHFGSPPEYHLQLIEHPSGWWDEVMMAVRQAL